MTEITELDGSGGPSLTVWFDGSCAFCRAEISAIRTHATSSAVDFIDCSAADFDAAAIGQPGVTKAAMMKALHARDSTGAWSTGVDAFVVLYRSAGLQNIAAFWAHPVIHRLATRLYPWIAANRYWLSRTGLPKLTEIVIRSFARRAARRNSRCSDGVCSIH